MNAKILPGGGVVVLSIYKISIHWVAIHNRIVVLSESSPDKFHTGGFLPV